MDQGKETEVMLDIYEAEGARPGARIMYHPKEGDSFVIEAAELEEGAMACVGCLFRASDAPICFDVPCGHGTVIFRKVCDAAAAKTSVQK
jgi:hypothetical protein